jgi:hypothetical protein
MLIGIRVRAVAFLQVAVTLAYVGVLGVLVPGLWVDPFGPLLKPLALIFASLTVAAMAEDR